MEKSRKSESPNRDRISRRHAGTHRRREVLPSGGGIALINGAGDPIGGDAAAVGRF